MRRVTGLLNASWKLTWYMRNRSSDRNVVLPPNELLARTDTLRQTYALAPLAGTTARTFVGIGIVDGCSSDRSCCRSGHHSGCLALLPLPLAGNDIFQLVSPFLWSSSISVIPGIVPSEP